MERKMQKLSDQEVRNIQIELLDEFVSVCNKLGLYYTLGGGTLLGAIRHKGFIPWDDDIDVLMPRPDYEKLLEYDTKNVKIWGKNVSLCNWKKRNSNCCFIKLVKKNTIVKEKYGTSSNNVWIDIFPIDGISNNPVKQTKLFRKVLFLRKVLGIRNAKIGEGKTVAKKYVKCFLTPILRIIPNHCFSNKLEKLSKIYNYSDEKMVAGILWGYGIQECMEKNEFNQSIKVEFEGKMYNAPSNYDKYLTQLYSNYMELPPKEKRVKHEYEAYLIEDSNK